MRMKPEACQEFKSDQSFNPLEYFQLAFKVIPSKI